VSASVASWLKSEKVKELKAEKLEEVAGKGVTALIDGTQYYLGSVEYISSVLGRSVDAVRANFTPERFTDGRELYLSDDREVLSLIKKSRECVCQRNKNNKSI
jgi:cation transport ATPase